MGNRDDMMRRGSCVQGLGGNRRRGWGQSARQGCSQSSDYGQARERAGFCGCGSSNSGANNSTEGLGGVCRLFGGACGQARPSEPLGANCDQKDREEQAPGCGCGNKGDLIQPRRPGSAVGGCRSCGALMRQLQELDFSIQETVLYLDAYPDCKQALNYYHQLVAKRQEVAAQYEGSCGPLTSMGNGDPDSWQWVKTPWPWHPDFPGNGQR